MSTPKTHTTPHYKECIVIFGRKLRNNSVISAQTRLLNCKARLFKSVRSYQVLKWLRIPSSGDAIKSV